MTLTFENDRNWVNKNQHAKYLGQGSCCSQVIVGTCKHTHRTNFSTWATKIIGKTFL